jgi:hypothetical protein
MKDRIMMPFDRLRFMSAYDLPDRLALTASDRRLESSVLLGLLRTSQRDNDASAPSEPEEIGDGQEVRGISESAQAIANFLATEYRAETLDQKRFIAELASEMAQRIAEELPGRSSGSGRTA